jgi:hypothetical protein
MIIFFSKYESVSITIPYRNGSQYFKRNSNNLGLIYFEMEEIEACEHTKNIVTEMLYKTNVKYFLYRNPVERFYSFFDYFLRNSVVDKEIQRSLQIPKNLPRQENFWVDLNCVFPYIEKNGDNNFHTMSQSTLKEKLHAETKDDVSIIEFTNAEKLLKLHFTPSVLSKVEEKWQIGSTLNKIPVTLEDFERILDTRTKIINHYKSDYTNLKTKIKNL